MPTVTLSLPAARRALGQPDFGAVLSAELAPLQNALPLERGLELGGWPEFVTARAVRYEAGSEGGAGPAALVEVQFREVLAGGCPAGVVSNERELLFWLRFTSDATATLTLVEPAGDRVDD